MTARQPQNDAPAPAGVRASWASLPAVVRDRIETLLGSRVVSAVNESGGFSPGLAARVRTADGTRAFVKACGTELNADSPGILRAEVVVARQLPVTVAAPRLRAFAGAEPTDADNLDGCVILIFDELDARLVTTPWVRDDVVRALRMLDELATATTPSPVAEVPSAADRLTPLVGGYAHLADDPPDDLDPWERRYLPHLADLGMSAVEVADGVALVHFDARSDNIMVDRSGTMWLVDWPWACRGAPWIDAACVLLDVALYGGDPEQHVADSRTVLDADTDAVTAFVAGLTGFFAERSRLPAPPGLPTLRAFQRANHAAALAWLRRRRPDLS